MAVLQAAAGPPAPASCSRAAAVVTQAGLLTLEQGSSDSRAVNGSPLAVPALAAALEQPAGALQHARGSSSDGTGGGLAAQSLSRHLLSLPFRQRAELFCGLLHVSSPELQTLLRHAPDSFAFDLRCVGWPG